MRVLWATIYKDWLILIRDRVGLSLMFGMPILLAILITSVQNSAFELVNDNKVLVVICNQDTGSTAKLLVADLQKVGMFHVEQLPGTYNLQLFRDNFFKKDALVGIVVPKGFSEQLDARIWEISSQALGDFGLSKDRQKVTERGDSLIMYYHPVLQQSYQESIRSAIMGVLQLVENKKLIGHLYRSINDKEMPAEFEDLMLHNQPQIKSIPILRNHAKMIPNATQHNIPAWTLFAMFFIVISLGSSIVKEKNNGSFVRLKTLKSSILYLFLSKQVIYMLVCLLQGFVIFTIGALLFPTIGLPPLQIPSSYLALLLVMLACAFTATSFAICIGIFANTLEQANGFGAVSIVILAAIGGLLVPSFAMPEFFGPLMKISPMHWGLEAFYGVFLEGGKLQDIFMNIIPLIALSVGFLLLGFYGLRSKMLI